MLLRPGHLTVRRPPANRDTLADALLDEGGRALTTEAGLLLVKE